MSSKLLRVQVVDMEDDDKAFTEQSILDAFQKYQRED